MSNRIVIQEGYNVPSFDGAKGKGRRRKPKTFGARMRACGKSWRSGRSKSRTWKAHLRKCLSK